MRSALNYLIIFFVSGILSSSLSSCKLLYPNRMFKDKDYQYFQAAPTLMKEYVIEKGDQITLEIFTREGFDLVDVLNQNQNQRMLNRFYLVDEFGFVELPIFGNLQVEGLTERELEEYIEQKAELLFNEPFVMLRVINRRCLVFKGPSAQVVPLNQDPTTLLEVLALSGGLSRDLKAYKVKIIRGDLKAPQIIELDLSQMKEIQNADLIVQANDIIYLEDRLRVTRGLANEIAPVLSLISSITTLLVLINVR